MRKTPVWESYLKVRKTNIVVNVKKVFAVRILWFCYRKEAITSRTKLNGATLAKNEPESKLKFWYYVFVVECSTYVIVVTEAEYLSALKMFCLQQFSLPILSALVLIKKSCGLSKIWAEQTASFYSTRKVWCEKRLAKSLLFLKRHFELVKIWN